MKFGFRKPSLKRRIAARASFKRYLRHSLGLKAPRGWGWLTNPKKAAYNRIYRRTTFGIEDIFRSRRRKSSGNLLLKIVFYLLILGFIVQAIEGLHKELGTLVFAVLSIAIVLLFVLFVYYKDKHRKEELLKEVNKLVLLFLTEKVHYREMEKINTQLFNINPDYACLVREAQILGDCLSLGVGSKNLSTVEGRIKLAYECYRKIMNDYAEFLLPETKAEIEKIFKNFEHYAWRNFFKIKIDKITKRLARLKREQTKEKYRAQLREILAEMEAEKRLPEKVKTELRQTIEEWL